jgi:hypothetical protein
LLCLSDLVLFGVICATSCTKISSCTVQARYCPLKNATVKAAQDKELV